MNKRFKNIMIGIVIFCIIILIIDIIVLMYSKNKPKEKPYFDSINAFEKVDDGYIAVGSNSNNNQGYEKAKITRYNNHKEKIWEVIVNHKYNSSFFNVKQDGDTFIAVGSYESTKEEHKSNTRSALIVQYDLEGNVLKEKKFQVLGNSKFSNLLVVEDGYIVVGQSIYEDMTLGLSDEGGAFIIKYDKSLNELWKSNYGGAKSAIYNDLILLDHYLYAVGKDAARVGIISKYTLNGERLVTTNYEQTDTLGFTSIVNIENKLYVVGSKSINNDQASYDTDALIAMYDQNCHYLGENTYKGKGVERYNKAIVDNQNIIIAGQEGIIENKKISKDNEYTYYGIFAKYNESLKKIEIKNYGDDLDDYFTDIKEEEGKYLISGYSLYQDYNYLPKFITYTKNGRLIGAE